MGCLFSPLAGCVFLGWSILRNQKGISENQMAPSASSLYTVLTYTPDRTHNYVRLLCVHHQSLGVQHWLIDGPLFPDVGPLLYEHESVSLVVLSRDSADDNGLLQAFHLFGWLLQTQVFLVSMIILLNALLGISHCCSRPLNRKKTAGYILILVAVWGKWPRDGF